MERTPYDYRTRVSPSRVVGTCFNLADVAMTMTREEWLMQATDSFRPIFLGHDLMIPDAVRASVGFPRGCRKAIGQAWSSGCSQDGTHEIFVSPVLDNSIKVLAVLAHELVHTIVGKEHGKPFKQAATALGLQGKMTATYVDSDSTLYPVLVTMAETLGVYPHAALNPTTDLAKKQGTRMLKLECPVCGCIIRTTVKWLETYPVWTCPCGELFTLPKG